jgi:hypothetical protein
LLSLPPSAVDIRFGWKQASEPHRAILSSTKQGYRQQHGRPLRHSITMWQKSELGSHGIFSLAMHAAAALAHPPTHTRLHEAEMKQDQVIFRSAICQAYRLPTRILFFLIRDLFH